MIKHNFWELRAIFSYQQLFDILFRVFKTFLLLFQYSFKSTLLLLTKLLLKNQDCVHSCILSICFKMLISFLQVEECICFCLISVLYFALLIAWYHQSILLSFCSEAWFSFKVPTFLPQKVLFLMQLSDENWDRLSSNFPTLLMIFC